MHRIVTPSYLVLLALAVTRAASADIIHLKNGDVIYADQAKENGTRVEYQKGDDTYTIPKSLVEKIDAEAMGHTSTGNAASFPLTDVPVPQSPVAPTVAEGQLLEQIIRDGHVNRDALRSIELRGDRSQTAVAYYIAAKQEFQLGDYSSAGHDFDAGLRYDPQNPAILSFYAALLIKTGNPQQALLYAEHAVEYAPDSADAFAVLGYAQYATDHPREAIQSWKTSLKFRPDASIQQVLARAQRESAAESNYTERETGHFVLRYEGEQSSESLRTQLLSTLESAYQDLSHEFGGEPRSSIEVVLYTRQAFFDVTRAPSWVGALNDGKLRIPLRGVDSVTPGLARILRHELTHSFVNQATLGRCPQWLNEGIAQMLEPRSLGYHGAELAQLFKAEREVPLNALESGFSSFSTLQAEIAYAESLAVTEYIRQKYGMSDILRILDRLAQGEAIESALRSTIHCDYRELQEETGAALLQQFGG